MKKPFQATHLWAVALMPILLFSACTSREEAQPPLPTVTASQASLIITPATEVLTPSNTPQPINPSPTATATPGPLAWRIPVLEYHNPTYQANKQVKMTEDWFIDQLDWLAEENFVTLTDYEVMAFLQGFTQPQKNAVVLRFDIGVPDYEEYANIVIPALEKYGFHAIFFLLTSAFSDDCSHSDNSICWDDLKSWQERGLISIASHGVYHPDYALVSRSEASQDAKRSKEIIEDKIGHEILFFAYPFDSVPINPGSLIQPLGYQGAFGGWPDNRDRSLVFGSQEFWEIPSYYPYSSDTSYPALTTAGPYDGSTFAELIHKAIEVSDAQIELLQGNRSSSTPASPTTPAAIAATTTLAAEPSATQEDPYLQYKLYCLTHYDERLDPRYLQQVAFPTDLSLEAQSLLQNPIRVEPVCHFDLYNQPEGVVLHYTGSLAGVESSISHFRDPSSGTSAHYLVDRDGTIIQLLPESYSAHHVSCYGNPAANCLPEAPLVYDAYGNYTRPSTRSIGIEIVNAGPLVYPDSSPDQLTDKFGTKYTGDSYFVFEDFDPHGRYRYEYWEPYTKAQLSALKVLIEDIFSRWHFNLLVGHNEIQENIDPGPALQEFIDSIRSGD